VPNLLWVISPLGGSPTTLRGVAGHQKTDTPVVRVLPVR